MRYLKTEWGYQMGAYLLPLAFLAMPAQAAGAEPQAAPPAHAARNQAVSTDDYLAIQDLYARYGFYADQREADAYARLYTSDGELRASAGSGGQVMSVRGRPALAEAIRKWGAEKGKTSVHVVLNPVLTQVAPDEIRAAVVILFGKVEPDKAMSANHLGFGMSFDTIVKVDGRWLFRLRESSVYNSTSLPPELIR